MSCTQFTFVPVARSRMHVKQLCLHAVCKTYKRAALGTLEKANQRVPAEALMKTLPLRFVHRLIVRQAWYPWPHIDQN